LLANVVCIPESPCFSYGEYVKVSYLRLEDDKSMFFDYDCRHKEDEDLGLLYELLSSAGYQMSDVELELKLGVHELFVE